jgi:hypothetical protein
VVKSRLQAELVNERGRILMNSGDLEAAESAYRCAVEVDPGFGAAWFNLGLVYKRRRNWEACLQCNERAAELAASALNEPAWWNLGIAATALRKWDSARWAWRAYGITIAEGTGPIEADFGMTALRLNPDDEGEVVWGRRIDPARAVIENIPFPESGHRWGDTILHDGAPNGQRTVGPNTYPVFDELERWQASDVPTLKVTAFCGAVRDSIALVDGFHEAGKAAEDWTRSVRPMCKACSEGTPHELHDPASQVEWTSERRFGLASSLREAERLLGAWADRAPSVRRFLDIEADR